MSPLRRVLLSLVAVLASGALPAAASAATRMYVSTERLADGTASVSGYAFDGVTQIVDGFRLDVVRGGATVATASASGFVVVAPPSLEPGDELALTDTTTSEVRTATFTGTPTLVAPSCGAAAFSGAREDGSTLVVSASLGDDQVPTVQFFGAGTAFSGTFAAALTTGWTVLASQARAIDAGFTVFDAIGATVGDACPVAKTTTPPALVPPAPLPAPVAPTPAVAPAPVADKVAPLGRTTIRKAASAYTALLAGTFSATVTVNEPTTVLQSLAAGKTTLATASKTIAKAGTVTLTFKLSKKARHRLTSTRSTTLTLATTLRDPAGNARALPARRFTAKRAR